MNGFYEWTTINGAKQPHFIALADDAPMFAVAGLYEDWLGPDGSEMRTAALLTRAAQGPVATLQARIPVVVAPQCYDQWLEMDETSDRLARAIVEGPMPDFRFWPVDKRVGSWKAEGEDLIAPVSLPENNASGVLDLR